MTHKRILAALLCIVLCMPALALADTSGPFTIEELDRDLYLPMDGKENNAYKITYNGTSSTTVTVSIRDSVTKTVYPGGAYKVAPGEQFILPSRAFGTWTAFNKPRQFVVTLTDTHKGKGTITFYQTMVRGEKDEKVILQEEHVWYPNNTVCSEGPHFRDMRSNLTDKWYTFSAVDLSIQGTQTFELIGGNMYVIGEVYVHVQGDTVTVTYHNYYDGKGGVTKNEGEFFTFFHDLASVTDVTPEIIGTSFAYGHPFSISEMLDGDTNVLLFVRNRASFRTYPTASAKLRRYWENTSDYKERRESMLAMMD